MYLIAYITIGAAIFAAVSMIAYAVVRIQFDLETDKIRRERDKYKKEDIKYASTEESEILVHERREDNELKK